MKDDVIRAAQVPRTCIHDIPNVACRDRWPGMQTIDCWLPARPRPLRCLPTFAGTKAGKPPVDVLFVLAVRRMLARDNVNVWSCKGFRGNPQAAGMRKDQERALW